MSQFRKYLPFLLFAGLLLLFLPPQLTAQSTNKAALAIHFGDGNVQTQCVEFSEPQISGYDLLLRSNLEVTEDVQGTGALVCGIETVGCPANDCLCQCQGGSSSACIYWSYWHRLEGNWGYSQIGASVYPVTDGAIEGWSWGPGAITQAIPPPDVTFEEVCLAEPAVTNTPTAVPATSTPIFLPTATSTSVLPPQIEFSADSSTLNSGTCTTLRWRVLNATAVSLNGVGVINTGAQEVCPAQTETHTLRVTSPNGQESRTLTISVLSATATTAATSTPTSASPATVTNAAPVTDATSVTLAAGTAIPTSVSTAAATALAPQSTPTAADARTTNAPTTAPTDSLPPTATLEINTTAVAPLTIAHTPTAASTNAAPTAQTISKIDTAPVTAVAVIGASALTTPTTAPDNLQATQSSANTETAVKWLPYLFFATIVLIIGILALRANRQTNS